MITPGLYNDTYITILIDCSLVWYGVKPVTT